LTPSFEAGWGSNEGARRGRLGEQWLSAEPTGGDMKGKANLYYHKSKILKTLFMISIVALLLITGAGCVDNANIPEASEVNMDIEVPTAQHMPPTSEYEIAECVNNADTPGASMEVLPSANAHYNSVAPDGENIPLASSAGFQLVDDGIFFGGRFIMFHDFETQESHVVCPLPDCDHIDATCLAVIGESGEYALYRGIIYALAHDGTANNEWHCTFKARAPSDMEWEILWTHTFPEGTGSNVVARIGGGYAVILANEITTIEETGELVTSHSQLVSIDLSTNTAHTVIPEFESVYDGCSYILVGVTEGKAILWWTGFPDGIIPFPDFAVQNELAEDDAWDLWLAHLNERRFNRILTVDLSSGEMIEIASGDVETLLLHTTTNFVYKGIIYFYYNGAITAHSVQNGETWELLHVPNVVNWFVFDGRVFFITLDEYGDVSFYYYVLESGKVYELLNDGNTEVLIFSPFFENSTMFLGLKDGGWHLIDKVDFYSENFDAILDW